MSEERFERWRAAVMRESRGFVAFHEAGHAVAAYLLHKRIDQVTIIPDADRQIAGRLKHGPSLNVERATNKQIEREIMFTLAGPVVDEFIDSPLAGSASDKARALNLAEHMVGSAEELLTYSDRLWSRTWDLLTDPEHWRAIEHVADALLEEERIGRKRVRQIIGAAIDYAGRPDPI